MCAGNAILHSLVAGVLTIPGKRQVLRIELEDWEGNKTYAVYDDFKLEGRNESYRLSSVGKYSGTAGWYDMKT